jgi:hypothetical protein
MLGAEEIMRKLLVLALMLIGGYLALKHFQETPPQPRGDTTPGANAQQRIDNLSGAAPAEH